MLVSSQEVVAFVRAALECSVYISPLDPWLSYDEIMEVGKRASYQAGELGDALDKVSVQYFGDGRLQADVSHFHWEIFGFNQIPEYRNFEAFDFLYGEFNRLIRSEGGARAKLERSVLVERAVARGIGHDDIQVATTISIMTGQLIQKDGLLVRPNGGIYQPLPTEQRKSARGSAMARKHVERAFPLVKDVIERRSDNRLKRAEPLDAFAEALDTLGYGTFRLWWKQTVAELNSSDAASHATSICVLAGALVEGALSFVVKHARASGLGVFASRDFESDSAQWRMRDLVVSASKGGESAIFDNSTRERADRLTRLRQRIHAGRMLSEYPAGVPDLRPEEAREARESAEIVVRAVLDWLERYPAFQSAKS